MKKLLLLCFLLTIAFTAKGQDLIPFESEGKKGFKDTTGKEIIPPIYDYISRIGTNLERRVRQGQKWGVINKAGVVIVPIQYDEISTFYNNSYKVRMGKKYGLIYPDLKLIPELKYDHFEEFEVEEGHFFLVKAAGKFGYINILGKEFIPLRYDFAKRFQEGYATVVKAGRWYFLNINGEEFPIVYNGTENFENVSALSDGFCRVTFKSKKGFIDKNRKLVIPVIYDDAGLYYDGRVGVKLNNKWGVIDKSGDIIMPIEYDKVDIYDLDKNITAIKNGKELYFDKTGKPIAKPKE